MPRQVRLIPKREPFRGETLAKYLQCRLIELVFNKRLPNFAFPVIPTEQQRRNVATSGYIPIILLAICLTHCVITTPPCRSKELATQRIRFDFIIESCTCRHLKTRKTRKKAFVCPQTETRSEATNPTTSSDRKCP